MSKSAPPIPVRSGTDACRRFVESAHALGVPRDYGRVRGLRRFREPRHLHFIGYDMRARPQWLAPHAAAAWQRMHAAARHDRIDLQVVSAFRGIEYQLGILQRKLAAGQSITQILQVSAAPGYSEHHTGRALDLTTPGYAPLEEVFETSPAFAWLQTHAGEFGFRLSYPRGNGYGIVYEPWHWCWHR